MNALKKVREICHALPDTQEGEHFGALAFKAGTRMYATYRNLGGDAEIVFALDPEHTEALLASDPRFSRYPRSSQAVVVRCSVVDDWGQIRDYLRESHGIATATKARAKKAKPAAPKKKTTVKKKTTEKTPTKKPAKKK